MTLIQWLITRVELEVVRHTHVGSFLHQTTAPQYHRTGAQVTKLVCANFDYLVAWFSASLILIFWTNIFPVMLIWLTLQSVLALEPTNHQHRFDPKKNDCAAGIWPALDSVFLFAKWNISSLSAWPATDWNTKKCEIVTCLCRDIAVVKHKKSLCYGP